MKPALKLLTLTLLVAGLLLLAADSARTWLTYSRASQGRWPATDVSVSEQEGAPLRVLSTSVESAEPRAFRLKVIVQNQSLKEIRAYAITSVTATEKEQGGNTNFINLTRRDGIWRPTEVRPIEVSDCQDEPIRSVKLTVDFVEFSDGTTWGPDANNSRDLLAGQREGARAERQRMRQLLKSKGRAAVAEVINSDDRGEVEAPDGSNRSEKWLIGFRAGVGSIRARLKEALQSGAEKMERELDRPFDTSEEN